MDFDFDQSEQIRGCASLNRARLLLGSASGLLLDESSWRQPASPSVVSGEHVGFTISRFADLDVNTRERVAEQEGDYYSLSLGIRSTNVAAYSNGRKVFDGLTPAGAIHLEAPRVALRGIFRAPTDALHVFFSSRVLFDLQYEVGVTARPLTLRSIYFNRDPVLESLLMALAREQLGACSLDRVFAEALCIAIASHLLRTRGGMESTTPATRHEGLAGWRVRRVIDYIEANLASSISLNDLARVAGLSRMHFAAQFRQATGLRPHECVLKRRIARAQEMMLHSDLALLPIATTVGFQSQAHFSRVFRQVVGATPSAWRVAHKR
ncbi:helix-turn-helix domain-containing protein [Paraburkholderia unamae]|uniref:AraC-like DNA-binding protein n=1 Tax=Paraburkholderia unamae TaxID=219649 RepID=A0ABX5KXK3_9BURK|nr:AraC family transcriptional regulator [Paraburkholderia unamae]PVX85860.1 AraC-like DNA-binding protein [Paraburkholderia unamae]